MTHPVVITHCSRLRERIDLDKKQKESVKKEQKARKREEIQAQQQAQREREEAAAEARRLVALERILLELPRSQSLTCVEPDCRYADFPAANIFRQLKCGCCCKAAADAYSSTQLPTKLGTGSTT
jgi:hypothetical protein